MVTALAPRTEIGHNDLMKLRFFALATLFSALFTAACSVPIVPVPAGSQPQMPAARPSMQVPAGQLPNAQVPAGQWIDWPITPGDWVYRSDDRGSIALFGPAGRDAIVTLRCDRSRTKLYFSRADDAGTRGGNMTIRTSSALKQFAAQSVGGTPAYIAAELTPGDSFLDAMIFTRGRIAVEAAGQQSIAIPAWSEVAKVVEDCRG
jgi:hypothetical protein